MRQSRLYNENFDRFARLYPLDAYRLEKLESIQLLFFRTVKGELNLIDERSGSPVFLYSQSGALIEAENWAAKLPLATVDVIFIYGVGLGYYYLPLKNWLQNDPKHQLVFLEDDPAVLKCFLETELASEILVHPQVLTSLVTSLRDPEDTWHKIRVQAAPLIWSFAFSRCFVSALQSYQASRFTFFDQFQVQWYLNLAQARRRLREFLPNPNPAFCNYYANIPFAHEAAPADKLFGAFHSIPAVVCGAGPSLIKQLPILKELKNRALILASGSATNILANDQIMPDAGGAIDHTATQASRLLTSFAYEMPAFYQNRFYAKALAQWQGARLYVPGRAGFHVEEWFDKQLELIPDEEVIMGISTTNFLLEIAGLLGCNPILMIGVDLAYTENERYAQGIEVHPADDRREHLALTKKDQATLPVPGVEGKDVYTTNAWFTEAVYIAGFKLRNPHITFLNATEGGMAIPHVPNVKFSDAVNDALKESWDIQGWLHGNIQNAYRFSTTQLRTMQAIAKWNESLERCRKYLNSLSEELVNNQRRVQRKKTLLYGPYSGKASLWQVELMEEPAYEYLLQTLDVVFDTINGLRLIAIRRMTDKRQKALTELAFEIERCAFLQSHCLHHLEALKKGLEGFNHIQSTLNKTKTNHLQRNPDIEIPNYFETDGMLRIKEKELKLQISASFHPDLIPVHLMPKAGQTTSVRAIIGEDGGDKREGQTLYFYPGGKIKAEAFYRRGFLHGPWSFFSEQGILLVRSWYVDGLREGKSVYYYIDGELYSVQGCRHGLAEGQHLFYYPNGCVKTIEEFDEGKLHGEVKLYYRNGQQKKEQHFVQGKLHGIERNWNEEGTLILEASYDHNHPIGTSRKWYPNGQLEREVIHGTTSEQDTWREWDEHGNIHDETDKQ